MVHPVEEAAKKILSEGKDLGPALARSLQDSIALDFESDWPHPPSPADISLAHGLALHFLDRFRIIIDKELAADFFRAIGMELPPSATSLKKELNAEAYQTFFGREVSKVGNRFVFTYAELQHFFGYGQQIALPAKLDRLLAGTPASTTTSAGPEELPATEQKPLPSIFLCHAFEDKPEVRKLHKRLKADGFKPWLDEEALLPGADWDREIPKAIRSSDFVLVCLSKKSVQKIGYVQAEIRSALERVLEMPPGRIFIIPARLEPCEVPDNLRRWHWVDLYESDGYEKLVRSLRTRGTL